MENVYKYIYGRVSEVAQHLNNLSVDKKTDVKPIGPPVVYYGYKLEEPYIIQLVEIKLIDFGIPL